MKKTLTIATIAIITIITLFSISLIQLNNKAIHPEPKTYTYTIINTYPHDTNAFTEGLFYQNGTLFESTGTFQTSQSTLRQVNLQTGNILQQYTLPDHYFAEGITILNNEIIQLTWQNHIGFTYNQTNFQPIQNFTYTTEGWGLTSDGNQLIMSDGTQTIHCLNATTFQQTHQIQVHDENGPIDNINELEYINGQIYANIWQTNKIAIINPKNGQINAYIDLTGLQNITTNNPDIVPNGIAYNPQNNTLLVTGKMWPHIFEIQTTQKPP
jgi:glutamine cyclotransferase